MTSDSKIPTRFFNTALFATQLNKHIKFAISYSYHIYLNVSNDVLITKTTLMSPEQNYESLIRRREKNIFTNMFLRSNTDAKVIASKSIITWHALNKYK